MKPPKSQFASLKHLSLERKLIAWTITLIVLTTSLCAISLNWIARRELERKSVFNADTLTRTVATSLSDEFTPDWSPATSPTITNLTSDPRISLIIIQNTDNTPRHKQVIDQNAYTIFQSRKTDLTSGDRDIDDQRPYLMADDSMLVLRRQPIWHNNTDTSSSTHKTRALQGYIILGVSERHLPDILSQMQLTQLAVAATICLILIPLGSFMVRRWTHPLVQLSEAARTLAQGKRPTPVILKSNDELSSLADTFNHMSNQLIESHELLQKNNANLESKVRERTQQLEAAVAKLEGIAATDPLTGLANRRAFARALTRYYASSDREHTDLACIMIDLDGFKSLNDTLGHQTGDKLLQHTAKILQQFIRRSDLAGRFGGDEFVLLLPNTDQMTAYQVAQRIQDSFNTNISAKILETHPEVLLSMSMGLATLRTTDAHSPQHLIDLADKALYAAKSAGKRQIKVYQRPQANISA